MKKNTGLYVVPFNKFTPVEEEKLYILLVLSFNIFNYLLNIHAPNVNIVLKVVLLCKN